MRTCEISYEPPLGSILLATSLWIGTSSGPARGSFGLEIVTQCPGVPSEMLIPRNVWPDREFYDASSSTRSCRCFFRLPRCEASARSGVSSEDLVHAFDRHSALAHRGGATFHRAGAHVARSKDAWPARLQRPWRTAYGLPSWRVDHRGAGFDETLFIASGRICFPLGTQTGDFANRVLSSQVAANPSFLSARSKWWA